MTIHYVENTVVIPKSKRGKALRLLNESMYFFENNKTLRSALKELSMSMDENENGDLVNLKIADEADFENLDDVMEILAVCMQDGSTLKLLLDEVQFVSYVVQNGKLTKKLGTLEIEENVEEKVEDLVKKWLAWEVLDHGIGLEQESLEELNERMLEQVKSGKITSLKLDALVGYVVDELDSFKS